MTAVGKSCALLIVLMFSANLSAKTISTLLPDEKNTISVFQRASSNVVYVHRLRTVMTQSFQRYQVPSGAGSGIIWDKKGHVVTNYHVIRGARQLAVTLGERTFKATLVGAEPRKDVAVLRIDSSKAKNGLASIKPLSVADSDSLIVGQKTIAIGNPFGLDHSLTTGVISALGRQVPGVGGVRINDMIQTDASINPGNSGGPLLNSAGQLIGMNTMIFSKSGTSSGIGFAVPADDIKRIVDQIIKRGRVVLPGIGFQRIEPHLARELGIRKGILIARVIDGSPAERAGLRGTYRDRYGQLHLGDIIVGMNGHVIKNYSDLYNLLSDLTVGDTITLTLLRNKRRMQVKIKTVDIASY